MTASTIQPLPLSYQAGAQIADIERRFGLSRVIKLASNENPLGPSPLALEALRAAQDLHRYPDERCAALTQRLARRLRVDASRLLIGNGTTELIDALIAGLCEGGGEVLLFEHTFLYYRISARNHGAPFREVRRGPGFAYDIDGLIGAIDERTRLLFLAEPDNPTGVHLRRAELERLLAALPAGCVLVLDEAYRDYVPAALAFDATEIVDPRLLLLRTFSKSYGLAALRCGYAVADPALLARVAARRAPFCVSALAQVAAMAALGDEAHLERTRRLNAQEREALMAGLRALAIPFVEGHGNFLLIETAPLPGAELYGRLLRRGVIVRPLDAYDLPGHVRVTVGLPEENRLLLAELAALLPR